jgi:hypothetical protein
MALGLAQLLNRSVSQADFTYSMTLDLIKIVDLNLGNKSVTNDIENVLRKIETWHRVRSLAFGSCTATPMAIGTESGGTASTQRLFAIRESDEAAGRKEALRVMTTRSKRRERILSAHSDKNSVITNVPTAEDFTLTGSNLVNLAWSQLADFEREESSETASPQLSAIRKSESATDEERTARRREYWFAAERELDKRHSDRPSGGVEFLLKGRTAQVSPYLLIVEDPRDWPRPDNIGEIDFSHFRAVDAIHLPRICEAISGQKLPSQLRNEYDGLRGLRNRALHSVGKLDFKPLSFSR